MAGAGVSGNLSECRHAGLALRCGIIGAATNQLTRLGHRHQRIRARHGDGRPSSAEQSDGVG